MTRKKFRTEQEAFWAGAFGDEYAARNRGEALAASKTALFADIFSRTQSVGSVIEFGANIGLNLRSIRSLLPEAELAAVEINRLAARQLKKWGQAAVYHASFLEFEPPRTYDFALIAGVLIHTDPAQLGRVYELLHRSSRRYICVSEYYNPKPVEVPYRGHRRRLFKRDFAGEMMDRFPDLRLVDYGFVYHRDPHFPLDDCTWFLMEKGG